MYKSLLVGALTALAMPASLQADFMYSSTTRMTGGTMFKMAKGKEPTQSMVAVKGNRILQKTGSAATVTDLDKETITQINYDRKTFSIITFAHMRETMGNLSDKSKGSIADTGSGRKVSVEQTGQSKTIAGFLAKETILTMDMAAGSQAPGAGATTSVTTDLWLAANVPGYQEMREFYQRMSQKMSFPAGGMGGGADAARGVAEMNKQAAKMDGLPMMRVVRMKGALPLTETTTEVQSVSNATLDPALFQVPAGFKEIVSPMAGASR